MAEGKYQGHKHHDQECYDENCGKAHDAAPWCVRCGHMRSLHGALGCLQRVSNDPLALCACAAPAVGPQPAPSAPPSITRPAHYGGANNPYEAIKVIEAWGLNFSLGNAVKYIARAGKKAAETAYNDLDKARQYIEFEMDRLRRKGDGK